jgi:hypothetical protein
MGFPEVPIATERCPGCHLDVASGTELCPKCGNPVDFGRFVELERHLKPELRKVRAFLGVVATLSLLNLLMNMRDRAPAVVIGAGLLAVACQGASFLVASRRPLGASIGALAYSIFVKANMIGRGRIDAVFEGLIFKIVILFLLLMAFRSAYRARHLRGQWSRRDRTITIGVLVGSAVIGLLFGTVTARLS